VHRYRVNFDLARSRAKWESRRAVFRGTGYANAVVSGLRSGHRLIPRALTLYVIIIRVQGARTSARAHGSGSSPVRAKDEGRVILLC